MPEKRLLTDVLLTAYHEIVPDPSARAVFLMRKLASMLYDRGARIAIGAIVPPAQRDVHHSLDADQTLMWVSKDWALLMGYRSHEAVGLHASQFMAGDTYRFLQEVGWPHILRGEKVGPVAVTYITKSGEHLPGQLRSEPMYDAAGNFLRTFARTRLREPLLHRMSERALAMVALATTYCLLRLAVV